MARKSTGSQRGAAFYGQLIERREREGLTWAQAARVGGTSPSTLYRWAQRLRGTDAPAFIELATALANQPMTAPAVEVVLAGGRILRVPQGPPPAGLLELVQLLEGTC